jgi:predicted GNAT family acetyltransferase
MSHPSLMVQHQPERARYVAQAAGSECLLEYRRIGTTLHITHTEVPPALQGRGLAAELVAAVLADVRAQGWRVHPVCSYVRSYMRRHPETQDLLETP